MTRRPGHRTMEMNGKSAVSYLVRTPRVPFSMLISIGLEAKGLLAFQGRRGIASVVQWNLRPVIFGVENANANSDAPKFKLTCELRHCACSSACSSACTVHSSRPARL